MRSITFSIAVIAIVGFASQAGAASVCKDLVRQFDRHDRLISAERASTTTDNSVPRASLRKLEIIDNRLQQLIILQLAQSHKCKLPTGKKTYILAALTCENV